jgi:hypothetical protein
MEKLVVSSPAAHLCLARRVVLGEDRGCRPGNARSHRGQMGKGQVIDQKGEDGEPKEKLSL